MLKSLNHSYNTSALDFSGSKKGSIVRRFCQYSIAVSLCLAFFSISLSSSRAQDKSIEVLSQLPNANPAQRQALLQQLQSSKLSIREVIAAMRDVSPVSKNLYLGIAQSIANHRGESALKDLNEIVKDRQLDPAARYWAFTVVTNRDETKREAMLREMLNDPSLELRYEAIALGARDAKKLKEDGAKPESVKAAYQQLLGAARLPAQVQDVAKELKELGEEVDLLKHFGFIGNWQVIGPFDNRNKAGFNVDYEPEKIFAKSLTVDPKASFEGKSDKVTWQAVETKEGDGAVDLNPIFKNEKGAIVYAYAELNVAEPVACEVRLGCINANKVWVNDQQVMSNEVYHAGSQIDQYIAPVKLKAGVNKVLIKVCQNEQTEQWAQDWKFQLRFSDASGKAIAAK